MTPSGHNFFIFKCTLFSSLFVLENTIREEKSSKDEAYGTGGRMQDMDSHLQNGPISSGSQILQAYSIEL